MSRVSVLQQKMAASQLDAVLLTSPVNRFYLTGLNTSDGVALVTPGAAYFLTDSRYSEAARARCAGAFAVIEVRYGKSYQELIPELVKKHGVKTLGFETDHMTVAARERWQPLLPVIWQPAQSLLADMRQVKDDSEIAGIVKAQRIAEAALTAVLPLLNTGVTEKQIAAELTCQMLKRGAQKNSFDPIVVSGTHTSQPHGEPGDRVIGGGFVTVDMGCVADGYCSDMTRTVAVGGADDEMKNVYELVLRAQLAGIAAAKAGAAGQDIDAAARQIIADAGYGDCFGHGFGHGVGLEIHEGLSATVGAEATLPAGSVLTAEPGIYLPGRFGVRIEDMLVLRTGGCDNLTRMDKELIIL